jgi:methylenetetrahydrofolate dehydrogenase (NADP+)/methenyltetrahydrofolate cyclohydrolase
MTRILDPAEIARSFRAAIRQEVSNLPEPLSLVGLLTTDAGPSATYAEYTRSGCEDVGIEFDLRHVHRLELETTIAEVNADNRVHGILVYYPVFGTEQDRYIRDQINPEKDIEGLHSFWARCLYTNRRFLDEEGTKRAILPCTPLAILKLLDVAGASNVGHPQPLAGIRACIFNRSEVVGRPLASMMANDGAEVVSFDVDGPQLFLPHHEAGSHEVRETNLTRGAALAAADVVISGVPSRSFPLIEAGEIRESAICVNFSTIKTFADDVLAKASVFIPRVGPMTVTMALRNTLRLYNTFLDVR